MASGQKTQCQLILTHIINHGYITPLVASNYGVERLASRIHDLKKAKFDVRKQMRRDDNGKRYARYYLGSNPPVGA